MRYNRIVFLIAIVQLCLFTSCTSNHADELYPSNDAEAKVYYETTLKSVIDNKCISCHLYHTEGANRYDSYEKSKSNISQMLERINATTNIVMPPADQEQLTEDEKNSFKTFLDILQSETPQGNPIKVTWTAYKYPDFDNRAGVSGTFNTVISYNLNSTAENLIDLLNGANVVIDASSVNVGNEPERTQNVASFFNAFTAQISGTVDSYNNENAWVTFNMNGISQQVVLNVSLETNKIILDGTIPDLNVFNWENAYNVFNAICGEYHENKLWEDVKISIEISNI
ncbi:YceI family protein [Algibacter amylolyticus]|uniref:YceI family protein n=1 Tax=Algibacter amylolyticus TaxID=1608400 RepID=A0A5M7B8M7_9FLAO|nr:YceI family protein [Algibacter amylolyticus]KAA5825719.1 YceI family protein [Algibacter amylolyticus]MBB5268047.1 hypothetical protein [Algibacter amylolyticus]TSJ80017.1 YceI family protein [Algibacter amylolyticus]